MSGRTKQQQREYRVRAMAVPGYREKRRRQQRESYYRLKKAEAAERIGAMRELLEFCQRRAIECRGVKEERGWLWVCRWVRSQMEREQDVLDEREERVKSDG